MYTTKLQNNIFTTNEFVTLKPMSDRENKAYENEFYGSSRFDGQKVNRSSKNSFSSQEREQSKGDYSNYKNGTNGPDPTW